MSEQKVVCLGSLKKILNEFPEILIRGKGIAGFTRYNALPPYFLDKQKKDRTVAGDHSGVAVDEKGLILVLQLADQQTNDPEVVQKLLKLPDSLVLGIVVREEGQGAQALVKKLTIELEPSRNVVMKLYSDDTGRATLFYDEIPELRELNHTNENWWLDAQMRELVASDKGSSNYIGQKVLQVRLDRGFEHPVYCIADGSLNKAKFAANKIYLLDESKLREWLPNLPKEDGALEPLLYRKDSSKAFFPSKYNVRQFSRSLAILFGIFGTPATFVEAIKEKQ